MPNGTEELHVAVAVLETVMTEVERYDINQKIPQFIDPKCSLIVSGLIMDFSLKNLRQYFCQFGQVKYIQRSIQCDSAVVTYSHEADAITLFNMSQNSSMKIMGFPYRLQRQLAGQYYVIFTWNDMRCWDYGLGLNTPWKDDQIMQEQWESVKDESGEKLRELLVKFDGFAGLTVLDKNIQAIFNSEIAVDLVMLKLRPLTLNGMYWFVQRGNPMLFSNEINYKATSLLSVRGVTSSTHSDKSLRYWFRKFGEVTSVMFRESETPLYQHECLVPDMEHDLKDGRTVIHFKDYDAVDKALARGQHILIQRKLCFIHRTFTTRDARSISILLKQLYNMKAIEEIRRINKIVSTGTVPIEKLMGTRQPVVINDPACLIQLKILRSNVVERVEQIRSEQLQKHIRHTQATRFRTEQQRVQSLKCRFHELTQCSKQFKTLESLNQRIVGRIQHYHLTQKHQECGQNPALTTKVNASTTVSNPKVQHNDGSQSTDARKPVTEINTKTAGSSAVTFSFDHVGASDNRSNNQDLAERNPALLDINHEFPNTENPVFPPISSQCLSIPTSSNIDKLTGINHDSARINFKFSQTRSPLLVEPDILCHIRGPFDSENDSVNIREDTTNVSDPLINPAGPLDSGVKMYEGLENVVASASTFTAQDLVMHTSETQPYHACDDLQRPPPLTHGLTYGPSGSNNAMSDQPGASTEMPHSSLYVMTTSQVVAPSQVQRFGCNYEGPTVPPLSLPSNDVPSVQQFSVNKHPCAPAVPDHNLLLNPASFNQHAYPRTMFEKLFGDSSTLLHGMASNKPQSGTYNFVPQQEISEGDIPQLDSLRHLNVGASSSTCLQTTFRRSRFSAAPTADPPNYVDLQRSVTGDTSAGHEFVAADNMNNSHATSPTESFNNLTNTPDRCSPDDVGLLAYIEGLLATETGESISISPSGRSDSVSSFESAEHPQEIADPLLSAVVDATSNDHHRQNDTTDSKKTSSLPLSPRSETNNATTSMDASFSNAGFGKLGHDNVSRREKVPAKSLVNEGICPPHPCRANSDRPTPVPRQPTKGLKFELSFLICEFQQHHSKDVFQASPLGSKAVNLTSRAEGKVNSPLETNLDPMLLQSSRQGQQKEHRNMSRTDIEPSVRMDDTSNGLAASAVSDSAPKEGLPAENQTQHQDLKQKVHPDKLEAQKHQNCIDTRNQEPNDGVITDKYLDPRSSSKTVKISESSHVENESNDTSHSSSVCYKKPTTLKQKDKPLTDVNSSLTSLTQSLTKRDNKHADERKNVMRKCHQSRSRSPARRRDMNVPQSNGNSSRSHKASVSYDRRTKHHSATRHITVPHHSDTTKKSALPCHDAVCNNEKRSGKTSRHQAHKTLRIDHRCSSSKATDKFSERHGSAKSPISKVKRSSGSKRSKSNNGSLSGITEDKGRSQSPPVSKKGKTSHSHKSPLLSSDQRNSTRPTAEKSNYNRLLISSSKLHLSTITQSKRDSAIRDKLTPFEGVTGDNILMESTVGNCPSSVSDRSSVSLTDVELPDPKTESSRPQPSYGMEYSQHDSADHSTNYSDIRRNRLRMAKLLSSSLNEHQSGRNVSNTALLRVQNGSDGDITDEDTKWHLFNKTHSRMKQQQIQMVPTIGGNTQRDLPCQSECHSSHHGVQDYLHEMRTALDAIRRNKGPSIAHGLTAQDIARLLSVANVAPDAVETLVREKLLDTIILPYLTSEDLREIGISIANRKRIELVVDMLKGESL